MGQIERKLYKILRNVGIRKNYICKATTIDDLFLDDYDRKLLCYYFEDEFKVNLKDKDIRKLTTLPAVDVFLHKKKISLI
jgi:hypothetical protein